MAADYQGALLKIDEALIEEPTNLPARLWWVQCQSELGAVPASALSAPLEEITPQLRETNALYESSIAAYVRVALRLLEKKQTKLAVVLLERAFEFSKLGRSVPHEVREEIRSVLLDVLTQEIERADLKRESKSYLSALEKKSSDLKAEKLVPPKASGPEKRERKNSGALSSASLLEAAIDRKNEVLEEAIVPNLEQGLTVAGPTHTRAALLISLCGALLIGLGVYLTTESKEEPLSEIFAVNLLPSGVPSLKMPTLAFAESAGVGLEFVTRRLERLKESKKEEGKTEPLAWNGPTPVPTVIPTSPPPPKQELSREDRAKLPEMNPDKLAGAVIESLGSAAGRNSVEGVMKGPDGRIYGPPPTDLSARSLDGSKIKPVEVEQLSQPQLYRVIAPTSVFSAPSVVAQSVARLEPRARVQVVAKLGKWLELRSAGGRKGYIYAQDAELER